MEETLELRPTDVNHLICKVFPTLRQGETAAGRAGDGPAGGRMGVKGGMGGVMPQIGVFRTDSWRNNFYKQKLTLLFKHGCRCRRFKQKN